MAAAGAIMNKSESIVVEEIDTAALLSLLSTIIHRDVTRGAGSIELLLHASLDEVSGRASATRGRRAVRRLIGGATLFMGIGLITVALGNLAPLRSYKPYTTLEVPPASQRSSEKPVIQQAAESAPVRQQRHSSIELNGAPPLVKERLPIITAKHLPHLPGSLGTAEVADQATLAQADANRPATHLVGRALEKALAEDVILTRKLNEEMLRSSPRY